MVLGLFCFLLLLLLVFYGGVWGWFGFVLFVEAFLFVEALKKKPQTHSEHNMTAEAQTTGKFQDAGKGGSSWANRALCLIPGIRGYCA